MTLSELLTLANAARHVVPKIPSDLVGSAISEWRQSTQKGRVNLPSLTRYIEEIHQSLKAAGFEKLFNPKMSDEDLRAVFWFLVDASALLEKLAQVERSEEEIEFVPHGPPEIVRISGNIIRFERSGGPAAELYATLRGELQNAGRPMIRECPERLCRRLFVARRKDQICCSTTCNNRRHQKIWYRKHRKARGVINE